MIIAYMVFYVLATLVAGVAINHFNELNHAKRYRNASAAFWVAEAGISRYLNDPSLLDAKVKTTFSLADGKVTLRKNDADPAKRIITSTGQVGGVKKSVQIAFAANPPEAYSNTLSVGGDLTVDGYKTAVNILDKARLGGRILDNAKFGSVLVEDKKEGFNPERLKLVYPDIDDNGVSDEFNDFVEYNRSLIEGYARNEVVYIQGNGTFTIIPDHALKDKKIVYVEGEEGKGDVNIFFGSGLDPDQVLTVISTGDVTFHQSGLAASGSKLNIIAWSGYQETAVSPSVHNGLIFTHGVARFDSIRDKSVTNGTVIANGGITFGEVWSTKTFRYADMTSEGAVPPGFEGLRGRQSTGYVLEPSSWREI